MNHQRPTPSPAPHPASALWLAVPVMAGLVGALGWSRLHDLQDTSATDDPQLAVAVLAAGACLAVAGWWLGGLLMLGLASLARVLRWTPVERWASHLTPRLVARTAGALVGAQLLAVAPAHADDAVPDPFWGPAVSGTEQLAPGAGSSAPEADATPSGDAGTGPAPTGDPARGSDAAQGGTAVGAERERPASPSADQPAGPASTRAPAGPAAAHDPAGDSGRESVAGASENAGPTGPNARERVSDGAVTVVAGDTLWDLTTQLLGPGTTDEAVCSHLGSWLTHNTLAQHGDLIRPGDVLRVPPELLDAAGSTR